MGGEPLCPENVFLTNLIIQQVKEKLPQIKIYVWSGYTHKELLQHANMYPQILSVLQTADYLIDGRYIDELRDITLEMRGSSNQKIISLKN